MVFWIRISENLIYWESDSRDRNKKKSYGNWIPLLTFHGLRKLILNQSLDQKIENELFLDHLYIQRRMNLKNIIFILQCNAGKMNDSDVSDIVMLVTVWWSLLSDVGGRINGDFLKLLNWSSTSLIGHQHRCNRKMIKSMLLYFVGT